MKPISEIDKEKEEQIISVNLLPGNTNVLLILLSLLCDKNKHFKIVLKTWLKIESAKEKKKLSENNNYKDTKS